MTLLILMLIQVQITYACVPEEGTSTPLSNSIEQADIILEGTVIELKYGDTHAVVSVDRYFKTSMTKHPEVVEISGFGSMAECLDEISLGDHRIFYAYETDILGELGAEYVNTNYGQATDRASQRNIEIILEITGQDPIIPVRVTATSAHLVESIVTVETTQAVMQTSSIPLMAVIVVIFIAFGVVSVFLLFRKYQR